MCNQFRFATLIAFSAMMALPSTAESFGGTAPINAVSQVKLNQQTIPRYHGKSKLNHQGFDKFLHFVNSKSGTKQQEFIDKKYIFIRDKDGNKVSVENSNSGTISTAIDNSNDENALNAFYQATTGNKKIKDKKIDLKVKIKESGQILEPKEEPQETTNFEQIEKQNLPATNTDNQPVTSSYVEPKAENPYSARKPSSLIQKKTQNSINSGAGYLNDGFHGSLAPGYEAANKKRNPNTNEAVETVNPEKKFHKLFKKYDRDENQIVSLREFSVYQLGMFSRLDKNGNNEISLAELRRSFKKNKQKGLNLLKNLDKNRNRIIERDEFRTEIIRRFRRYDSNKNGVIEIGAG